MLLLALKNWSKVRAVIAISNELCTISHEQYRTDFYAIKEAS